MEPENDNPFNKRNGSKKGRTGPSNIDHFAAKLAKEYSNEKDPAKRMAILEKGLEIRPNSLRLLRFIAWRYVFNSLPDKAMNHFRRVLEIEGPSPDTYCGIGAVKFLQEDFSSAMNLLAGRRINPPSAKETTLTQVSSPSGYLLKVVRAAKRGVNSPALKLSL